MEHASINSSINLSEHLTLSSEAALGHLSELNGSRLSPHFTLGELCKTSVNSLEGNIPGREEIENLKRLCPWLEELRKRYNQRYVSPPKLGGVRGGLNSGISGASSDQNAGISGASSDQKAGISGASSDHPAHPGTPPDSGGEEDTEEPIIISSGYRSPEVNRCVGGAYSSNHLTGCAVDIRCVGVEQAIRYAAILLDIADEWKQDYDELLIEKNRHGHYWVHFAVRPKDNRRKTMFLQAS